MNQQSAPSGPAQLAGRRPEVSPDRLLSELAPPPRFAGVRFASYQPDPARPSQAEAVRVLERFAATVGRPGRPGGLLARLTGRGGPGPRPGVYLDGGYGVGKTHLLASLWHAVPGPAAYGTFVEFTNLVGALGFAGTVRALSGFTLVCIDEFELDDPGDTVLMARLMRELVEAGVRLAATSNTLPEALGEGRFAAEDFVREIQAVAQHFEVVRIEGEDYRHRGMAEPPPPMADEQVERFARTSPGATVDAFERLVGALGRLHPSRYGALLDGVTAVGLTGVRTVTDQSVALRLVVLADRMYDRDLPLLASGQPLDALFSAEMLRGGYRKKYRRAMSRLTALARQGQGVLAGETP